MHGPRQTQTIYSSLSFQKVSKENWKLHINFIHIHLYASQKMIYTLHWSQLTVLDEDEQRRWFTVDEKQLNKLKK